MNHDAGGRPWQEQALWRVLLTGHDAVGRFFKRWAAQDIDVRHARSLHVVVATPSPDAWVGAAGWAGSGNARSLELSTQLQGLLPGVHRISLNEDALQLTLLLGDSLAYLRAQDLEIDEIDHQAESAECQAWATALARCSHRGTRLTCRGAQAELIHALTKAGFCSDATHDIDGSIARGVWQARFDPAWEPRKSPSLHRPARAQAPGHCLVVGAGLAGAACAASLARRGWAVTVLDREGPAAGASSLPVGLMAPHVSADDSPLSRLSRAGVRATLQQARQLLVQDQDWAPTGVLQRRLDDGAALPRAWPAQGRAWSREASELQDWSPSLRAHALWHACGAWIKPARLAAAWLAQPGISLARGQAAQLRCQPSGAWQVLDAQAQVLAEAELVLLAAAQGSQQLLQPLLPPSAPPGLQPIRGQVCWGLRTSQDMLPPAPVNGHGSLVPDFPLNEGRAWLLGASFDRDDGRSDIRRADDQILLDKLEQLLPEAADALRARLQSGRVERWAGVRCAWRDHLPVVGPLSPELPGLWLCTAFGSRGLSYSALCAELMAAWLHGEPLPLEARLAQQVRASRLLGPR